MSSSENSSASSRSTAVHRTGADAPRSDYWYFTRDYNTQVFRNISRCFLPDDHQDFMPCPPKPLILDGWWYSAMVVQGGTSGEVSAACMSNLCTAWS